MEDETDYESEMESLQRLLHSSTRVEGSSPEHMAMTRRAYDVRRLLMDLNCNYHTHDEIVDLFSRLTGKPLDPSFGLFPPFLANVWILFVLLFFLGIATGPFWPSIQSYCVDRLKDSDATMIYILLSCAGVPGCGFFSWVMGYAGDQVGLRTSFYLVPICYAGLGLLILIDALCHRGKKLVP